jgi:hypothetical protein
MEEQSSTGTGAPAHAAARCGRVPFPESTEPWSRRGEAGIGTSRLLRVSRMTAYWLRGLESRSNRGGSGPSLDGSVRAWSSSRIPTSLVNS